MEKDHPTTSHKNNNDESTEEEIIEDISMIEAEEFSDSDDDIPIFLNDDLNAGDKKRQLFDIDDDSLFLDDVDKFLSADSIAKHFKPSELDPEEVKENIVPSNSDKTRPNKSSKVLSEHAHFKELSPLKEDDILINDKKVSLSALKKVQSASSVPNIEVPNELSTDARQFLSLSFPKVPAAVSLRTSHSLDLDLSLDNSDDSLNDSVEHENSIDEIIEHHEYRSETSEASESDDKISETTKPLLEVAAKLDEPVVVKKMEKVTPDYLKEPLDDITEEESEAESKEHPIPVNDKTSIIEKGSQVRAILGRTMMQPKSLDKDEHVVLPSSIQSHSLDLSTKSVRELQDIVIEKDSCLDALNLQLTALARRENFKDGNGRESLKESAPYSIATSASTEYRTINEDFNMKILDIENELQERAACIEQLNEKLILSVQEREQYQLQSEKLAQEVLELRTKVAGIESLRSSDEDKTVISASRINDFKKSLPDEEAACFSKVWTKFESFHKSEIDQLKLGYDEEIKRLQEMLESERKESEDEVNRWRALLENVKSASPDVEKLCHELEAKHSKEMEELREYFEKRCVDMEKQYSEEVFSQHSKRHEDIDTDGSDNETLPDDDLKIPESPMKAVRESPVKRKSLMETSALSIAINEDVGLHSNVEEVKLAFNEKINAITKSHEEIVESLRTKLKRYESNFHHGEKLSSHQPESTTQSAAQQASISDLYADNELSNIINEYERRLEEQVALAREDVLHEIETHIQALLSENSRDDSHWPPELILLREKLTAKSQLEIAQLKIKHEEEMARMKTEYELQLQRRLKRHASFDAHRDLDKIITERDSLRDLSASLRFALCELAKYFTHCEEDLNNTINEELNKGGDNAPDGEFNISVISSTTKRLVTFKPDISSLIAIVEDPQLLEFISKNSDDGGSLLQINIVDCLERLNSEANNILGLSEQLCKRNKLDNSIDKLSDKTDSCEEEDGLKRSHCKSLEYYEKANSDDKTESAHSLPVFHEEMDATELSVRMMEMRSQLIKSEEEKRDLQKELNKVIKRSDSLEQELQETKSQLGSLNMPKEDVTEGFGTQTPTEFTNKSFSLVELQEKAKTFLTTSPNSSGAVDHAIMLYQLIEDFCRETDRYMETEKKNNDDLQLQIEAADKQLKATRQFLEDQATEREQERDEFSKEIEKLRVIVKEKEKDKTTQDSLEKEISNLEQQIKDLNTQVETYTEQKAKYEEDLKASIDKVFDLREIIADLETQVQTKALNENFLSQKCKELENYINHQDQANESLKDELDGVRADVEESGYAERIRYLEDQLKLVRPSAEQKLLTEQMTSQLKTIEMLLDRKTKTLEAFHALASTCSTTCSSPSEDVSRGVDLDGSDQSPMRVVKMSTEGSFLPFEEVQRILEKLSKHNRIEEATVKKVTDLEMQVNGMRSNFNEIQQEKDILQERMSEQLMKISSLQSRLDEQRIRAEELNKQSTSDLTLRVHDLQNELSSLRETLTARDKQISNLNQLLEHSKKIIDRQENELAFSGDNDKSLVDRLEGELKRKSDEIQRLKDKIQTEMINKVVLPDLMETMLAEKNEEIDSLREQLMTREQEVVSQKNADQSFFKSPATDNSTPPASCIGGTILSMISEYEEPDQLRDMTQSDVQFAAPLQLQQQTKMDTFNFSDLTQSDIQTDKATMNSSSNVGSMPKMPSQIHLVPRHITFSSNDESSVINDEVTKLRMELEQITKEKNLEIESYKMELNLRSDEMSNMQLDLAAKTKLYEDLMSEKKEVERELDDVRVNMMRLSAFETTLKKKDEELNNSLVKIQNLEMELKSHNQDLDNLRIAMNNKDENIQKLSQDLMLYQNKCKENERMLVDLERLKQQVTSYNDVMAEKENLLKKLEQDLVKYVKSESELLEKAEHCDKLLDANQQLENSVDSLKRELSLKAFALEKCKFDLQEMEQKVDSLKQGEEVQESVDVRNISVEEITAKLERELKYSAELDGNIIKAIESESEVNSELEELGVKRPSRYQEKMKKLEEELENLKKQYQKISSELDDEKKNSDAIQMQDASLIEAIKIRLEAALDNENVLKKMLDTERQKTDSLSSQLTGVQRTKSFDNYLLFNKSSVPESPRRLAKLNEFESEVVSRLESEIKLLSSQNERERDRVTDLQKVLDRERDRFTKAIADQQEYSEQLKREVKRLVNDKEMIENELDQLNDLKMKYFELEREKDKLMDTVRALRNDIDRGTKRETKLADALLKESDSNDSVPEQFMQKLKEISKSLADNVRENHQMAETLQLLTEERRALQQKIAELESSGNLVHYSNHNNHDLEERANHLFAKYMRCESFRKALVYQKRFLLITIATTIGYGNMHLPLFKADQKKRKSLRSVVLVVIAIERMKYIARRWTGKRMTAKVIFSAAPKRSQSATNNNWATFARMENNFQLMNSPPSRERQDNRNALERPGFQLPSPSHHMKQAPLSRIFSVPEAVERKKAEVLQRLFES